MDLDRTAVHTWLTELLTSLGETPTSLARRAGVAQSTLTRFLNNEDSSMLSTRSIAKIAHATGDKGPPGFRTEPQPRNSGLAEPEAVPFKGLDALEKPLKRALAGLLEGRNATDVWVLRTTALIHAGYLPGDFVIVDLNATPKAGDVVCAQVYQWALGTAETVFRIYEPPYLVAPSADPQLRRPLVVDNDRVVIKGVVTHLLR